MTVRHSEYPHKFDDFTILDKNDIISSILVSVAIISGLGCVMMLFWLASGGACT